MKKIVENFIRSLGGSTNYSGNKRIMYINDLKSIDIEQKVVEKFGYTLPFKLITNSL